MHRLTSLRAVVLIYFLLSGLIVFSQNKVGNVKSKFLGTYEGQIPAYLINLGESTQEVQPSTITFEIKKNGQAIESIDGFEKEGIYMVSRISNSDELQLLFSVEGYAFPVKYQLNPKTLLLHREGFGSQPNTLLKKK